MDRTPVIGILMLDTTFTRIVGDIGNPQSFSVPVAYKIIPGATVTRVVKEPDPSLLAPFIEAASSLQEEGVKMLTTSCGFLALFQKEMAQEIDVPFYSSSLLQIPFVYSITGGPIGILTARQASLTPRHLAAVGAEQVPVIIYGMDDCSAFTSAIVDETEELDPVKIEQEMIAKAAEMCKNHPDMKAIVLECTNMPPYREAIKEASGLPVFDIFTLTDYVQGALPKGSSATKRTEGACAKENHLA
ncbi:aspartate/glutamate racemase family protein [Brevibacillus reuszeri]|uniref:aspartate/glutamate racemase family protein n=1 Tax=Brevibacillus reuszeri TaxID=54915 RepID=UPI003D25E1BF